MDPIVVAVELVAELELVGDETVVPGDIGPTMTMNGDDIDRDYYSGDVEVEDPRWNWNGILHVPFVSDGGQDHLVDSDFDWRIDTVLGLNDSGDADLSGASMRRVAAVVGCYSVADVGSMQPMSSCDCVPVLESAMRVH
jgi:hypothetical protein